VSIDPSEHAPPPRANLTASGSGAHASLGTSPSPLSNDTATRATSPGSNHYTEPHPPAGSKKGTTIHDLRHIAASLLIAAGADVKAVQVILGHSTATMTMDLYGHLFSEATWQAMERLPVIPLMQAPRAIEPPPRGSAGLAE
jgi:hypothetical protein